jgi:hypothetical protein
VRDCGPKVFFTVVEPVRLRLSEGCEVSGAMLEPPALVSGLDDVAAMREAIQ